MLEIILTSTTMVAFAEIGDKTQLLAIVLATRFRRRTSIILGILVATLANHGLAALVGEKAASLIANAWFSYALAVCFMLMAAWLLIPDRLDEIEEKPSRSGAFLTTVIAFFLVEMGDKTQLATIALGARFHDVLWVTAGTTLGMMLVNVPAVLFGNALIRHIPLKAMRITAAVLFLVVGIWLAWEAAGLR